MASEGITIAYVTHRPEPRFQWFADSLARQLGDDVPEVVLVDGLHTPERGDRMAEMVRDRFPFRHVPAKPTPFNGAHRVTEEEYMGMASARNTGVLYATDPYLVFVDDLAVLIPGWWDEVRRAAADGSVVAGAYQKHQQMVVRDGELLSSEAPQTGIDTRWDHGDDSRRVQIVGGQMYGCSFGAPRELLLEVNGLDEICDSVGGEDYQLGLRLEWAGAPIFYSRRMLTVEAQDLHRQEPVLIRMGKSLGSNDYMTKLAEFGVTRRSTDGPFDISHMILDILYGTRSVQSLGNYYALRELTEADLPGTVERFPSHHWFDGTALAEM